MKLYCPCPVGLVEGNGDWLDKDASTETQGLNNEGGTLAVLAFTVIDPR